MLTLKQVITTAEPEIATFELPIAYQMLTNLGEIRLFIDPWRDEDCDGAEYECRRAPNGNCLLIWKTVFEVPGTHALQTGLILNDPEKDDVEISGPLASFVVSNLCQLSPGSAHFEQAYGVTVQARLPEQHGVYRIEFSSLGGGPLKTITGSTSNGVIKAHWDLLDEAGNAYTNDTFDGVFQIGLPDSVAPITQGKMVYRFTSRAE